MNDQINEASELPVFGVSLMHEVQPIEAEIGITPYTDSGGTKGECF